MTLLEIVQAACRRMAIPIPASVIGNPDPQVQQLLGLAEEDGNELYRWPDGGWTTMQQEHIINVEIPVSITGNVVEGSTTISNVLPNTTGIIAGQFVVTGSGMPDSQRVLEVVDANTLEVEMQSSATEVGAALQVVRDTYEIPSDFDHYQSDTWWDRTNFWRLIGPISPQTDQWDRSGIVTTGPRRRWRQIGHSPVVFRLWPPPSTQDAPATLVFEYISNGWVRGQDGVYKSAFTLDTDEFVLNPQMMIQGIRWRFLQIKGFQFADKQTEYTDFVNREVARDGGNTTLSLVRYPRTILLSDENVQDGNWPGSGNP